MNQGMGCSVCLWLLISLGRVWGMYIFLSVQYLGWIVWGFLSDIKTFRNHELCARRMGRLSINMHIKDKWLATPSWMCGASLICSY